MDRFVQLDYFYERARGQLNEKISTWSVDQSAPRDIRVKEYAMEKRVSEHIRSIRFYG